MKLDIINTKNVKIGDVVLPSQFNEVVRSDLITRAVLAIQANKRQRYGAKPEAGMRASAYLSKRRHNFRGTYGIGQSRTPRKAMSRRGTRFFFVGAFAPQTVGGRRAHPPKATKIWDQKINVKERRKAIRSALSATIKKELVSKRGHKIPSSFPFVLSNDFEAVAKTKDLILALKALGFENELERGKTKTIRAGIGKRRGRKYLTKKSILFVVENNCSLMKSAKNIPGCDIVIASNLNAEYLAPGTHEGRLTLFTQNAISLIEKNSLFTNNPKPLGEKS